MDEIMLVKFSVRFFHLSYIASILTPFKAKFRRKKGKGK